MVRVSQTIPEGTHRGERPDPVAIPAKLNRDRQGGARVRDTGAPQAAA